VIKYCNDVFHSSRHLFLLKSVFHIAIQILRREKRLSLYEVLFSPPPPKLGLYPPVFPVRIKGPLFLLQASVVFAARELIPHWKRLQQSLTYRGTAVPPSFPFFSLYKLDRLFFDAQRSQSARRAVKHIYFCDFFSRFSLRAMSPEFGDVFLCFHLMRLSGNFFGHEVFSSCRFPFWPGN